MWTVLVITHRLESGALAAYIYSAHIALLPSLRILEILAAEHAYLESNLVVSLNRSSSTAVGYFDPQELEVLRCA